MTTEKSACLMQPDLWIPVFIPGARPLCGKTLSGYHGESVA
jgi:hypothetical protein